MSRFYIRIVPLVFASLVFLMLFIHVQPHDDTELRQLLLPDNCPAPCFMGIRPGVTSMNEMVKLLNMSKWVGGIRENAGTISWTWLDFRPGIIDTRFPGYAQHSNVPSEDCCVGSLKFNTLFTVGDLYLLLGNPARTNLVLTGSRTEALVSISYVAQKIRVYTRVGCPINRRQFWEAKMEIYIESNGLYTRESGMSAKVVC